MGTFLFKSPISVCVCGVRISLYANEDGEINGIYSTTYLLSCKLISNGISHLSRDVDISFSKNGNRSLFLFSSVSSGIEKAYGVCLAAIN